jgi:hypothetical protein
MIRRSAICLLVFMRIVDHVSALCREEFLLEYGIYSPGVIEYTDALARKDWPRFRDPFDIPSPRVEDGRIYPGETGFHWYANFPGNTEKVTFQYVVDVVENDDISTHGSLPGVCDTCPTFGDDTTTTNGFSIAPSIDEDGKLQTRFRLPNSTSTEPMFYTVSRTKSNTLRMEITLNTPHVPDGTFRLWIDGLLVKEDLRVLYRYYDDIFIRSMSLQTTAVSH